MAALSLLLGSEGEAHSEDTGPRSPAPSYTIAMTHAIPGQPLVKTVTLGLLPGYKEEIGATAPLCRGLDGFLSFLLS